MAAFESLPDWIEQAASIMADPVYICMAEEGDEPDDDVHPALAEQQQILIHDRIMNPVSPDEGTQEGARKAEDATFSVFMKAVAKLRKSRKSFEEKLATLELMGMDHDEAIDALCISDEG